MSLILSSVDANIEFSPGLKALQSKNRWTNTNTNKPKKVKKSVRWSDSLVEVIEIPSKEKETEFVNKKTSMNDREGFGSLLAGLFYSTVNNCNSMELNGCLGEPLRANNPSNSQNLDLKHFCSLKCTTTVEKELSFKEKEDEQSESDTSKFHLGPLREASNDEVITDNNETVLKKDQAGTHNLQHILASLSSFSGEGKRYLNVMF